MKLPDYSSAHVLVVGDLMLDRYWHGAANRLSPEAPVPVVHVQKKEHRAGGAANVAMNIANLGAKVSLIGFVGHDDEADILLEILQDQGICCLFEVIEELPTLTKLRVISHHQQLIRMDFEEPFHTLNANYLLHQYHQQLVQADVVVLSDYGKGTLHHIKPLIALAKEKQKPVLIDPKGSDFSRYQQATLMTPNLSELEAVVGICKTEVEITEKGQQLLNQLHLSALLITRGEQGMSLLRKTEAPLHLATHAREVFDVTGAGDTVIAMLAASLAAEASLEESTLLANISAGIVVGKLGTAIPSLMEINEALNVRPASHHGVKDMLSCLDKINAAKKQGQKIVLTNGCFDLLHLGHITYLQEAKALGDRLVVLVNSDASVKRLKGASRPINGINQRMEMLAALKCVDWVMAFNDDTPQKIIAQILPDILVKGGDYTDISLIAGHHEVLKNGGEVKVLSFVKGHSTSHLINTLKSH